MVKGTKVKEMVWPVDDYTNKIHYGMKYMFQSQPNLSFNIKQMREHLQRGYAWLKELNERQSILLDKIISTGIKKLIQHNLVVKVTSNVSTESQWQARKGVADSGYTNITSIDAVAQSTDATKASKNRAVNAKTLWELNQKAA